MEVTSVVTVMPITSIGLTPRLKRVWRRINKANGSPNSQADGCPGAVLSSTFGGGRKYDLTVLGLRLADDSTIMVGRSSARWLASSSGSSRLVRRKSNAWLLSHRPVRRGRRQGSQYSIAQGAKLIDIAVIYKNDRHSAAFGGLAEVARTLPMIAIVDITRLVEGASDDSILDSCGDDSR